MSRHLRLPLTVGADGTFVTVPEDSDAELIQNVTVILRTRPGERLATPEFGTPDPTFTGLDVEAITEAVSEYEPRADVTVVGQALRQDSFLKTARTLFGEVPYGEGVFGGPPTAGRNTTEVNDLDVRRRES